MSRQWLLFLFCLSVVPALVLPSRAALTIRVDESATRVKFEDQRTAVSLAVDNPLAESLDATIQIEIVDPENRVRARAERGESIGPGSRTISFLLPFDISKLPDKDRQQLIWYRLNYRISARASAAINVEGILSLSEITPDLFEIRVAAAEMAHEGMRYRARVQAVHPVTRKPANQVQLEAVLTLETDDTGNGVKLRAAGVTDSAGYVTLFFNLPPRFPEFPHELRPAGGSLRTIARRGGLTVQVENQVLVDQFPRLLISTDKPIYQPGQTLHLRVVVLSPTRRALANQDVLFRIEEPDNTNLFRETVPSSRFGIATADWQIPENARLGDYWVKVSLGEVDDSSATMVKVRISRYDLPNFAVKVQPDQNYYLPGQHAEVKVSADYLFGRQVTRGHVRVVREVEREWNYREQKWDIEEGDKYEGETDSTGVFLARVDLSEDHNDLSDADYRRFRDITYAAYFTDPTTRRTEQRRFDLRVTRDPIHVYVFRTDDSYYQNPKLPLRFYVSTYYADGTPAQCRVSISESKDEDSDDSEPQPAPKILATLRTNRYGLGKVSRLRVSGEDEIELKISARQANGKSGSTKEEFDLDEDHEELRVDTDKSLYRPGEPVTVSIVTSLADSDAIVDVGRDAVVLDSRPVHIRDGHGTVTISYRPEFKDRLTIAAYPDFPKSRSLIGTRTILYPRDRDLRIEARPLNENYRPGDEAEVSLRVRGPKSLASALGIAITDKAVDERFRTDSEFGNDSYGFYRSIFDMLGYNEQVSGVTFRDLERLDLSKPVPADLELVAEALLNQGRNYYPVFFGGDRYEDNLSQTFGQLVKRQLAPTNEALGRRYASTREYPKSEPALRQMLSQAGIDFPRVRDPWGTPFRPAFSVDRQFDVLNFTSAGADKRFDTDDDFSVAGDRWMYFRTVGEAIDAAVRKYHERTGSFIREPDTLGTEAAKEVIDLDTLIDRWGWPYHIGIDARQSSYVIRVSSGGPDKRFEGRHSSDDFIVWESTIDYFAETRAQISNVLAARLKETNLFPRDESDLRDALRIAGVSFADLRDPWGRTYYSVFKSQPFYGDIVRIENRGQFGSQPVQQTQITPVTKTATVITLRSAGPDGKIGTWDDFDVATFTGTIVVQTGSGLSARSLSLPVVFSGDGGAITGTVTDPNRSAIAGVNVTATSGDSSQSRSTLSDDNGRYNFLNLAPGLYELRFTYAGFNPTVITSVLVRSSSILEVNVTMQPGAVSETVEVSAGALSLQTSQSDFSVNARQVQALRSIRPGLVNVVTKPGSGEVFTPRLREYFPETLLWQPSLETDGQGRAQLKFKLADNITTWKMSVIGSTEDGEIGFVEKEIKAFQPFFVEHDPPKVLTEGDEISLPVVVRNYLDRAQPISLDIKPENWFSLLGPSTKRSEVAAGDATKEIFAFRTTASVKEGKQRITAIGADASDAIEKPITVHPDGEERSATASDIVYEGGTLALDLPRTAIPNSIHAELKIYPNLLAHVAESIEAIMERPYGCGEQTISSAYPSLLWLKNYQRAGPPADAAGRGLQLRAERYLRAGYDRLLNYRDESGGFTYWGHGDPDLALTAYALRFLSEARGLIAVDEAVIKEAGAWLIKQQRSDGSWAAYEYGNKIEDKRRTALLTAYVARVLAITKPKIASAPQASPDPSQSKPAESGDYLQRAFEYLSARSEEIDEPYLIASYALAAFDAGDTARAEKAVARLRALAHEENNAVYWSLETNTPFYGWGMAGRVETTALSVQALVRSKLPENNRLVRGALLFLLKQKDRYGVWHSTQATINVLDAMLSVLVGNVDAERKTQVAPTADIIANGQLVKSVELPPPSRLTSPLTIDLTKFVQAGSNRVEIKSTGSSSPASVQAVATYYWPWIESWATQDSASRRNESSGLRLVAKFDKTESNVGDQITGHVEAERIGFRGYGMLLAEIGLPPGADVDRASLDQAVEESNWGLTQYDVLPDRVVVYLWPRAGGVKFDFKFRPRFGLKAQTAPSVVYDYYNPEARAVVAPAKFVVK